MSMIDFFYTQLFAKQPYPEHQFAGQTVIVTGSNTGLGLEAARHFTRLNAAKVILAVRSPEKGKVAKESIEESTKRTGVVDVWPLDLSNYESVKQFAVKAQSLERLDVLVENAGIVTPRFSVAEDNESTITVNVVSTFLLALLILPKLRDTAKKFNIVPNLVIVSSEVHFWTPFPQRNEPNILEALKDEGKADMNDRYNVSKLMEVLFVRALAPRLTDSKKPEIVLNYLTPGLCHSDLSRGELGSAFEWFKYFFARTTEAGSRSLVHAAQGGKETHGQFLWNCKVANPSPFVLSEEGTKVQDRVFEEISEKLDSIQPGIMRNV